MSVAVDQEVDRTVAALHVLAELDPNDDPDAARFAAVAAHMLPLHRGWQAIRLMDSSLRVLVDTAAVAGEPSPVFNPRWVQQVLQTGEPAVSTVFKDPSSGQWVVSVGVAVKRRGSIKHVLGVRLFAQNFSDILNRTRLPADGVVALLDTDRRIIARTLNQDRYIGGSPAPDFAEQSRSGTEGTWRTTLLEGVPAYSAWVRSPVTGWTVGVGLPSAPLDRPIRRSFVMLIALGVAILGAGIVLATYLSRGHRPHPHRRRPLRTIAGAR